MEEFLTFLGYVGDALYGAISAAFGLGPLSADEDKPKPPPPTTTDGD